MLESNFNDMLRVNRRVQWIDDQPQARLYVTPDGRLESHTFDFLVRFLDGTRIAYAVKPRDEVDKSGIRDTLEQIRQQSLKGFADKALLVTETVITSRLVFNAKALLSARKMRNNDDVEIVRDLVLRLQGAVRLTDLAEASRLGARGRNAVLCLIDEGLLTLERNAWIKPSALLRRNLLTEESLGAFA